MTCDRLVCANCAGPVEEGRCPVCRAERRRLHSETLFGGMSPMSPAAFLGLALALLAVTLLVQAVTA